MKVMIRFSILIAYILLGVIIGVADFGAILSSCLRVVLAISFVWLYVVNAGGRSVVPMVMVIFVTLVLPIGLLSIVAWPHFQSWSALATVWLAAFAKSPLGGLDIFFPLAASALTAMLTSNCALTRRSSGTPQKRGAP